MIHDEKTIARFMAKVAQPANRRACWFWKGEMAKNGYGLFVMSSNPKTRRVAHRISWEIHYRTAWPDTLVARHLCHNKKCVNAMHIAPGTQKENIADSVSAGRFRPEKTRLKTGRTIRQRLASPAGTRVLAPWSSCAAGHDLTLPGSRYESGNRECRLCALRRAKEHKRKQRNAP